MFAFPRPTASIKACCFVLASILSGQTVVAAADYPTRQVTIVVPYAAGGTADILGRLVAEEMHGKLSQPFVVENKGGASGVIGASAVARAQSDGYTLLFTAGGPLTIGPNLGRNPTYRADTDFTPIGLVSEVPSLLVVNPNSPIKTVSDLVAAAKAKPGDLKYASPGVGTSVHLLAEFFRLQANIDVIHVPYRGGAPAMNDLIGGQVDYMFENMPQLLPQVKGGTLRALAVTAASRQPASPDTPTLTESGIKGVEVGTWYGLLGPKNLPAPVTAALTKAFEEIVRSESFRKRLAELGAGVDGRVGAEFAKFIAADDARWKETIARAKIEPQ